MKNRLWWFGYCQVLMGVAISAVVLSIEAGTVGGSEKAHIFADILQGPDRTPSWISRDQYRHPSETLEFFTVRPEMTVVEIWPGRGWYTEILGPYLEQGKLYAAHFSADSSLKYFREARTFYAEKLLAYPEVYSTTELVEFSPKNGVLNVPDGSADRVLTFRNVHNWLSSKNEADAFNLFFKALKPGGILGVVEHRAPAGTSWETMKVSGYMTEAYVIELAERAGFTLDGKSEVNANPKDSADHPKGVWTLPPTLRLKQKDREKYLAVGESDRMTLRFKKPE